MTAPFIQGQGVNAISNYLTGTLLPTLTTLRLANIYDHELTDLAGFPAATVTLDNIDGSIADNARNKRVFTFTIRIFIDRNKQNFGSDKAEQILRAVADEFILKIDADSTLGNTCINALPATARFGYINREFNNIRVCEIQLQAIDVVTWR